MKIKIVLLIVTIFLINVATTCEKEEDPVYVNLVGINVSNVNNEGKYPTISDERVKKEAYMIGVKYVTDAKNPKYNYAIKDSIESIKILSNSNIDTEHPAGSDLTNYFIKTTYAPDGINYSLLLKKSISPGVYSFRIILSCTNGKTFDESTNSIELY